MRLPSLLAIALIAAGPAAALGPVAFGPDPAAEGWSVLTFRGRAPAAFAAEGPGTLRLETEAGVAVLWRALPPAFANAGTADWRWRVDAGPPPTDLTRRGGEDRAIALYFLFADDAAAAARPPGSLREALRRGRALVYVWGGDAAEGAVLPSPQLGDRGRLIVARSADAAAGTWKPARADLRADFRRAFGREPGPLAGVAVSTDGDDTGSRIAARIADLTLR